MMEEVFFTGYCRAMDSSRTVTVEIENHTPTADCAYDNCPHAPNCPIAAQIRQLILFLNKTDSFY